MPIISSAVESCVMLVTWALHSNVSLLLYVPLCITTFYQGLGLLHCKNIKIQYLYWRYLLKIWWVNIEWALTKLSSKTWVHIPVSFIDQLCDLWLGKEHAVQRMWWGQFPALPFLLWSQEIITSSISVFSALNGVQIHALSSTQSDT